MTFWGIETKSALICDTCGIIVAGKALGISYLENNGWSISSLPAWHHRCPVCVDNEIKLPYGVTLGEIQGRATSRWLEI